MDILGRVVAAMPESPALTLRQEQESSDQICCEKAVVVLSGERCNSMPVCIYTHGKGPTVSGGTGDVNHGLMAASQQSKLPVVNNTLRYPKPWTGFWGKTRGKQRDRKR